MHRTKKMAVITTGVALLMATGMSSAMANRNHDDDDHGKVTICHRTASDKNPYRKITISESAVEAHRNHPPKGNPPREDIIPAPPGGCPTGPTTPPPPPPPAHDGDDCTVSSSSGDSTQSQHGLVNVGNINLGLNNLLGNAFCQSNVGNGLGIAVIGDALGGFTGSGSGDGDCSADSVSGDSNQEQEGLVNVGNVNLGLNNLAGNAFCQSNLLNGLAIAGIGDAIAGDVDGSGDGDCSADSVSGDSDQDQDFGVNVGNVNLGGDNLRANAFCQSDVLNGRAVSLIGPAFGGGSALGDGLLSGAGGLLTGLTTDVSVLAKVLVTL